MSLPLVSCNWNCNDSLYTKHSLRSTLLHHIAPSNSHSPQKPMLDLTSSRIAHIPHRTSAPPSQKSIEMMLTSTPIKDTQALKLGLVEEIVPADKLLAAAKARALDIAEGRKPRLMSLTRTDRIEALGEALPILEFARAQVGAR